MQLVIIGARNTGTSLYLVSLALRYGYSVTVLTAKHDDLSDAFESSAQVVSLIVSTESVIDWIEHNLTVPPAELLITTTHDLYATIAAQVAAWFGVPGPDKEAVAYCVSKTNQAESLRRLGFQRAAPLRLDLSERLSTSLFETLHFPVVIKPVEGSASQGISQCHTTKDVFNHLEQLRDKYKTQPELIPRGTVLIEQFITGQEYCVELFDGVFVGVIKKIKRAGPSFIERGYSSDTDLTDGQIDKLILMAEKVSASLHLMWGPVHIDCIINEEQLYVIEVNPRIAGSFISAIIRDAWGFDIADALLQRLRGEQVEILRRDKAEKYAQVIFFLSSDPESWRLPVAGHVADSTVSVRYASQIVPERERRAYVYTVVG
ncbi:ATP-grasp domain-containing protein [Serratia fonticola]|uniref:ATP-grasp domain-containing protein n=1 Tax=Serratia fonticola TaxID=47917 RepID=A0AAJ1YD17_SERFO|nr:ATP-grasp domain-containing protein [Serratia fonticola]MDQ9125824.1 ATP-grasp domain-containing protein [Serratia fonticola]